MRYDARNAKMILTLHEAVQHKVWQGLEDLSFQGEDVLIADAFRSNEEQAEDYAKGRTAPGDIVTDAKPGWSFHNYGLAVDLVPIVVSGDTDWKAHERYDVYGKMLQAIGFQWGFAMWKKDRPHFQYTQGLTIQEVRAGKRPDIARARTERLDALKLRLVQAQQALAKPNVSPQRKKHLQDFIIIQGKKISQI